MTDADFWRAGIEAICAEHDLPFDRTLTPGREGSNAVFLTDTFVVKIFAAPWPIWVAREVECLRVLSDVPDAKTSRLLARGPATNGDARHPYLVMERLPGQPMSDVWDTLSPAARQEIAAQVGTVVRALHTAPLDPLSAFDKSPEGWVRRMRARAEQCPDYMQRENALPPHLLAQLPGFFRRNMEAITQEFAPRLLSGDIHGDHILVARRGDTWEVTGHLDFGDAEVGPVEYEWYALCLDAFKGDACAIRAFFQAYGQPMPLPEPMCRRMKLYTLLHRFAAPTFHAECAGKPTDAPTLDALLDSLWNI
jgi:hygromycin-B 7''-O-kinase